MAKIPLAPKNNEAILAAIENKLGPVGKGHHESHRRAHILAWLKTKEKGGSKADTYRKALESRGKGGN